MLRLPGHEKKIHVECVRPRDNEMAEVWVRSFELTRARHWVSRTHMDHCIICRGIDHLGGCVASCIAGGRATAILWTRSIKQSERLRYADGLWRKLAASS